MMRASTGWIRWGDTDLFVPPAVITGNNGWIYRPDEARTAHEIARGTNKAFPRKDGYNHAHSWYEDYLRSNLNARNWEIPTGIEHPTTEPRYASDGLTVAYKTKPWGWVTLQLVVRERNTTRWDEGGISVAYAVVFHQAVDWFAKHSLEPSSRGAFSDANEVGSRDGAHRAVVAFMENPWEQCVKYLHISNDYREVLSPPAEDLMNLPYPHDLDYDDQEHDTEDIVSWGNGSAKYWKTGEVAKTMAKEVNWVALNDLLGAFKHLGYEVAVVKSHNWDADIAHIKGLTVTIPQDPTGISEAHKQVDHKFKFTATGIAVTCGFEHDEAKWIERETRKAREALSLMEKELGETTEFTIEL